MTTIEELKKDKLKSLEEYLEKHFYTNYPQYKNNNFNIDEKDEEFRDFCTNANYIYNYVIKQVERAETKKELDKIRVNENMFNEAPF